MKMDLHLHSTASDGTDTPTQLVLRAATCGMGAIALTDHDTVAGVAEAIEAGKQHGVVVIPGVEISVDFGEMHILGYGIDIQNEKLLSVFKNMQQDREIRNIRMLDTLQKLGIAITFEDVKQECGGDVLGRLHIAKALVKKGVCRDVQEAFNRYLAEGKEGFVERKRATPSEGIKLITEAGGTAVLAHPTSLKMPSYVLSQLLKSLKKAGLHGIECYFSSCAPVDAQIFQNLAVKHHLWVTGGSDYHGESRPDVLPGTGLESWHPKQDLLQSLCPSIYL